MYVRIETHSGFRIKGFRSKLVTREDIIRTRNQLSNALEQQHKYPRTTYGVILSDDKDVQNTGIYYAGIVGDSSIKLETNEEVMVSSGKYVIAVCENEEYDSIEFLQLIQKSEYFHFRNAPIVEIYTRDLESGKISVELWVPIE
ncbi:hypothetical protein KZO01_20990 [Kurthia zopfii]|uniref:Bacterial transcription activator, effector binding domain n=1 Tax=Kurthia zopfii TaxID=1650 RepID=A0A2U3AAA0_9BACL|nr:hypothetical protein [Kurthia zopfii]PWI21381.1 hypothetical protein DF281_12565 [Kurthia zopfii]TDR34386.1 hypothetical protein DFR61_13922 [Kurthia zopfii]STX10980.1 Bacterial transcription activator, effector binding domain [Kurthia zopfii]VEI05649.1 Bacterial transcription activator, effector binding domain [Kurthia zopfii]GEK31790.1 hypothetical protein KZO01_20990 [Kurthia zopfii]